MVDLKSIKTKEVHIESENGQMTFDDVVGNITGKTKAGQITFANDHIDQSIQLETGHGKIVLETEQNPANAEFDVQTGSGKIDILGQYTGNTVIGNGENLIKLKTGAGSITIY
ncbi:DUF4097 family beta strand repeat-containing protein [Oceanobacillus iheyensis]